MGKTLDLDAAAAARREANEEGPVVQFKGEKFTLPVELPFGVIEGFSAIAVAQATDDGQATAAALIEMAKCIFDGDDYARFTKLGPSSKDLEALFEGVMGLYGVDDDQGESQASDA